VFYWDHNEKYKKIKQWVNIIMFCLSLWIKLRDKEWINVWEAIKINKGGIVKSKEIKIIISKRREEKLISF
jgi:hypothetical protein